MTDKVIIAAFDFDCTITTRDTFLPFLSRAFGTRRVQAAFLKLGFEGLKVLLGYSGRDRFKERLVDELFLGESVNRLTALGEQYADDISKWVRPSARKRIDWHQAQGHRLIMVSASLDLYLECVAAKLGFHDLLCRRLSKNHMQFDGKLRERNCRGPEKVRQLELLLGSLDQYEIYSYGDSAGDKDLLEVSTHPHWQPFTKGGEFTESVTK